MIVPKSLYIKYGLIKGIRKNFSFFYKTFFKTEYDFALSPRFRRTPYFTFRKTGELQCISCKLCVDICPTDCIELKGHGKGLDSLLPPQSIKIEEKKCISCGYCVEACPVDAIRLGQDEVQAYSSDDSSQVREKVMSSFNLETL